MSRSASTLIEFGGDVLLVHVHDSSAQRMVVEISGHQRVGAARSSRDRDAIEAAKVSIFGPGAKRRQRSVSGASCVSLAILCVCAAGGTVF